MNIKQCLGNDFSKYRIFALTNNEQGQVNVDPSTRTSAMARGPSLGMEPDHKKSREQIPKGQEEGTTPACRRGRGMPVGFHYVKEVYFLDKDSRRKRGAFARRGRIRSRIGNPGWDCPHRAESGDCFDQTQIDPEGICHRGNRFLYP